jgi:tetratricopeptide (TPR) repeat protein
MARSDEVVHSGFLWKLGYRGAVRRWKPRFAELTPSHFLLHSILPEDVDITGAPQAWRDEYELALPKLTDADALPRAMLLTDRLSGQDCCQITKLAPRDQKYKVPFVFVVRNTLASKDLKALSKASKRRAAQKEAGAAAPVAQGAAADEDLVQSAKDLEFILRAPTLAAQEDWVSAVTHRSGPLVTRPAGSAVPLEVLERMAQFSHGEAPAGSRLRYRHYTRDAEGNLIPNPEGPLANPDADETGLLAQGIPPAELNDADSPLLRAVAGPGPWNQRYQDSLDLPHETFEQALARSMLTYSVVGGFVREAKEQSVAIVQSLVLEPIERHPFCPPPLWPDPDEAQAADAALKQPTAAQALAEARANRATEALDSGYGAQPFVPGQPVPGPGQPAPFGSYGWDAPVEYQGQQGPQPTMWTANDVLYRLVQASEEGPDGRALDEAARAEADEVAFQIAAQEIAGARAYLEAGVDGLSVPLMAVVDYRGFRVLALALFGAQGERTQVYGLLDGSPAPGVWVDVPIATGAPADDGEPPATVSVAQLLLSAARRMHTAPHLIVARTAESADPIPMTIPCSIELQAHHIPTDNRIYLMNLPRVCPPDLPTPGTDEYLTKHFRPEFMLQYPQALSPDAYTAVGGEVADAHQSCVAAARASQHLQRVVVPTVVRDELDTLEAGPFNSPADLVDVLHRHGVNSRYLGLVADLTRLPLVRDLAVVEMVSRACAMVLSRSLRRLTRHYQTSGAGELETTYDEYGAPSYRDPNEFDPVERMEWYNGRFKLTVVEFFNLVLGAPDAAATIEFFSEVLAPIVKERFNFHLSSVSAAEPSAQRAEGAEGRGGHAATALGASIVAGAVASTSPQSVIESFLRSLHRPALFLSLQAHCGVAFADTNRYPFWGAETAASPAKAAAQPQFNSFGAGFGSMSGIGSPGGALGPGPSLFDSGFAPFPSFASGASTGDSGPVTLEDLIDLVPRAFFAAESGSQVAAIVREARVSLRRSTLDEPLMLTSSRSLQAATEPGLAHEAEAALVETDPAEEQLRQKALQALNLQLEAQRNLYGLGTAETAGVLSDLAALHLAAGRFPDALLYCNAALGLAVRWTASTSRVYRTLCRLFYLSPASSLRDVDRAHECYQHAIAVAAWHLGPLAPAVREAHTTLGDLYAGDRLFEQALEYHSMAHQLAEAALGAGHVLNAAALLRMGRDHMGLRQGESALRCFEKALYVLRAATGPTSPAVSAALLHKADALVACGSREAALAAAEQALQLRCESELLGAAHPATLAAAFRVAELAERCGYVEEAVRALESLLIALKEVLEAGGKADELAVRHVEAVMRALCRLALDHAPSDAMPILHRLRSQRQLWSDADLLSDVIAELFSCEEGPVAHVRQLLKLAAGLDQDAYLRLGAVLQLVSATELRLVRPGQDLEDDADLQPEMAELGLDDGYSPYDTGAWGQPPAPPGLGSLAASPYAAAPIGPPGMQPGQPPPMYGPQSPAVPGWNVPVPSGHPQQLGLEGAGWGASAVAGPPPPKKKAGGLKRLFSKP